MAQVSNDYPEIGKPRYNLDDTVEFRIGGNSTKIGVVEIVDRFGTFGQNKEPSYDIFVEDENTLFKHIIESHVVGKV